MYDMKTASNMENTVLFGEYNGKALEWIVLAEEDGKVFLLSKYCIADRPYHETEYERTSW